MNDILGDRWYDKMVAYYAVLRAHFSTCKLALHDRKTMLFRYKNYQGLHRHNFPQQARTQNRFHPLHVPSAHFLKRLAANVKCTLA